ncbi:MULTISPECIES: hypothetical protein [unclassified Bacteroides]|jgi:hypothetical protein|uniref:hypothetical protein n=1 Tax=unclassified Bacteroides TaxID=2646097 RepID=UPI000E9A858E|nr:MULTISPECIES: hypothetical protein [unclassified Bacteroides]RGN42906.1 hypothetical protein DXB63_16315 [Bacteroides sp. OM05-12]RHR70340.1 hypothetical protein DWW69_18325 [Bacteroides sp. AF16-49]
MGENTLFKAEEMQDSTATAIQESDTRIQRMSKIFAKRTNLSSDTCHLMIAYQRGAIDMKNIVLEALCRDCPCRGDCKENEEYVDCESYNNISRIFDK